MGQGEPGEGEGDFLVSKSSLVLETGRQGWGGSSCSDGWLVLAGSRAPDVDLRVPGEVLGHQDGG